MSIQCGCIYDSLVDEPGSTYTTVFEFLFSVIIGISGIKINYRFILQLKEERRKTPPGRKGNVIEPIMRWFLWFQILYWPYNLMYYWINVNGIIPSKAMNGWWCIVLQQIALNQGRLIISFNSLFVAAIRYVYIIHSKKANQWKFEMVGKWIAISSFAVPIALDTIKMVITDYTEFPFFLMTRFNNCTDSYHEVNNTGNGDSFKPITAEWALYYLPKDVVLSIYYIIYAIVIIVAYNLIEGFLYLHMHQNVKR